MILLFTTLWYFWSVFKLMNFPPSVAWNLSLCLVISSTLHMETLPTWLTKVWTSDGDVATCNWLHNADFNCPHRVLDCLLRLSASYISRAVEELSNNNALKHANAGCWTFYHGLWLQPKWAHLLTVASLHLNKSGFRLATVNFRADLLWSWSPWKRWFAYLMIRADAWACINVFRPPMLLHRRPITVAQSVCLSSVCRVVYCGQTVQDRLRSPTIMWGRHFE